MVRLYYKALEGFRRRAAWCVVLATASGLAEALGIATILPLLSGALASRSSLGREYFGLAGDNLVGAALAALVVLGLVSAILRYLTDMAMLRLQADVEESLRSRMTASLFGMAWPSFLQLSLGETGKSVLIEATQVGLGAQYFVNGLGYAAVTVGFVAVAAVISPALTAATIGFGAVMGLLYRFAGKRAQESSRHLSLEAAELTETTTDLFGNAKFYRSTGLRGAAIERAAAGYAAWKRIFVRVQRWQPTTRVVFDAAGLIFISGILTITLLIQGQSPLEPLVFLALFYRLAPKLQQAQQGILNARAQGSWWSTWEERRAAAVHAAEVRSGTMQLHEPPEIAFQEVTYVFPSTETPVLDAVSWHLSPGECLAVVGESGSGKTTLLDLVTGLLRPTSGAVLLDDTNLVDVDLEVWRNHIGFVIQDAPIFFGTVVENIAWADLQPDHDRAMRVAELANLGDVVRGLPQGLDTPLGYRGARLSGGQRQRVALARALYREPWLLVLDEATSALDSASEREVQEALQSLKGMQSILIVAHRLATVEVADRILVLSNGRVAETGTWRELRSKDGLFRRMATAQALAGTGPSA
jgi:ABC-type multidrug transport system fused ATPase/permease subunit